MISLIKEVTRKISLTNDVTSKGNRIITKQTQIETLEQEVISKGNKITTQQKQIQTLEQQVRSEKKIEQIKKVDMNLKEKKKSLPEQK